MKKTLMALGLSGLLILSGCKNQGANNIKNESTNSNENVASLEVNKDGDKHETEFYDTFDTVIHIAIYTDDDDFAKENLAYAKERYQELHKLFDNYKNYDGLVNVKTVNDEAGVKPVVVDDVLFDLIKTSVDDYKNISHNTNVALGPVTKLWNEYRDLYEGGKTKEEVIALKGQALPSDEELEKLRPLTNIENVKLDGGEKSVYLEEGMELDLGATAKGYATELVAQELRERGVTSCVISAGGNVRIIGKPTDGRENFRIGIQNPDLESPEQVLTTLNVANTSIVTSGDYQRYFDLDGVRYCHIIDPDTLKPAHEIKSVTVIKDDSGLCDFLSTAAFNSTDDEIRDLAEKSDAGIVWVDKDMKMMASENAEKYLDK
ncbi:FAD:protein FMN transferase [Peptoniphilus harei]|uniref:FAD:protein FMN transferase n=1 Tax=Peptoniphilus harei TaxID=54005 RepID=A0A943SRE2_9FIRM|nr:FAD:protein FMN transferase [Peptoniphilus harei]MBS6535437.1 FAD:protein FMN transferase [Peptoniphilus harei]